MKQNSMAARTVGRLRTSIRRIRWRIEGSAFVSRLKRLWDNFREPPVEQWLKTMKQSEALISKRDMEGLIRFVKQWRHSVKIVGILSTQMAAAELFRTPEEAADAKMTELMDALHKTRFMARYRRSPQYHDPQQNDCIRGMLAMHDYLLNAARDRYPQRNYRWMHPSELRETEYIRPCISPENLYGTIAVHFGTKTPVTLYRPAVRMGERRRPARYALPGGNVCGYFTDPRLAQGDTADRSTYGAPCRVDTGTIVRRHAAVRLSGKGRAGTATAGLAEPISREGRTPLYEPLLSLKIRHPARSVPCRTHLEDRAGGAKDRDSPRTNDGTHAPHRQDIHIRRGETNPAFR